MFNSPFKDDQEYDEGNPQGFSQSQQPQVTTEPESKYKMAQLSQEDYQQIVENLKPQTMTNPIKITEPSYLITETQMKQLLGLNQGVNGQIAQQFQSPQVNSLPLPQGMPRANKQQALNMFDSIGNMTFGTVGRIGHTITGVVDGVIDIVTLGYSSRR